MATQPVVTKVWIEPGCIVCDACETAAPTVFEVTDDSCVIRPEALNSSFTKPLTQAILDAAEECPVNVIKFETVTEEASTAAVAEPSVPVAVASELPASSAPVDKPPAAPPAVSVEMPATSSAGAPAPAKPAVPVEKPPRKSPEAPAPKPVAEPATAAAAKAPAAVHASVAGASDPAIATLLRAATSRGGSAGIQKQAKSAPPMADALQKKDPRELPPDARQARILEAAKKVGEEVDEKRREFLSNAALATGWIAFGAGLGVSCGPAFARFMMPNVLEEPDPRVRVGKLQRYVEMAPGEVNEDFKPQGIWIIREDERVAALSIICTHLGCIPNWLPNDRKFKCPCHGSGYKPSGINFEGPTPRPLERFRVYVEDGIVVVDKSKKYQYELGQWEQPGSFLAV